MDYLVVSLKEIKTRDHSFIKGPELGEVSKILNFVMSMQLLEKLGYLWRQPGLKSCCVARPASEFGDRVP